MGWLELGPMSAGGTGEGATCRSTPETACHNARAAQFRSLLMEHKSLVSKHKQLQIEHKNVQESSDAQIAGLLERIDELTGQHAQVSQLQTEMEKLKEQHQQEMSELKTQLAQEKATEMSELRIAKEKLDAQVQQLQESLNAARAESTDIAAALRARDEKIKG